MTRPSPDTRLAIDAAVDVIAARAEEHRRKAEETLTVASLEEYLVSRDDWTRYEALRAVIKDVMRLGR